MNSYTRHIIRKMIKLVLNLPVRWGGSKSIKAKKKNIADFLYFDPNCKLPVEDKKPSNIEDLHNIYKVPNKSMSTNRKKVNIDRKFLSNAKIPDRLLQRVVEKSGRSNGRLTIKCRHGFHKKQVMKVLKYPDFIPVLKKRTLDMYESLHALSNTSILKDNKTISENLKNLNPYQVQKTIDMIKDLKKSDVENFFKECQNIDLKLRVLSLHYNSISSNHIALVRVDESNLKGLCFLINATSKLYAGRVLYIGNKASSEEGNVTAIRNIPDNTMICNIESDGGISMVKSAGNFATILNRDQRFCTVRLPSGEETKIALKYFASIGMNANINHNRTKIGSAGDAFRRGYRPRTSANAMNSVDHAKANKGRGLSNAIGGGTLGKKTSTMKKRCTIFKQVTSRHAIRKKR